MNRSAPFILPFLFCVSLIPATDVVIAQSAEDPSPPPSDAKVLEAHPVDVETQARLIGTTQTFDYKIGRQDLLEISVFGLDELDQTVRVSTDGTIHLPLLGRLSVAGMSKRQLELEIGRRLEADFVHNPQVTVFVKEYQSKMISVTGAVKRPGSYQMLGNKTLLEMISLAGGLDKDVGQEIVIFRTLPDGRTERLPINLKRLVYQADPSQNIRIQPEDIVYIPVLETVRIFVSGAVKSPDLYEVPRSEPVTVLKAITLAGGTTDRAAEKKIQILRTDENGERVTLLVNLKKIKKGLAPDPILQPDDLVLVPESFF
jgi:polysaccharide export outer membrane protein